MNYKVYYRHTVICGSSDSLRLLRGFGHNLVGKVPADKLRDLYLASPLAPTLKNHVPLLRMLKHVDHWDLMAS